MATKRQIKILIQLKQFLEVESTTDTGICGALNTFRRSEKITFSEYIKINLILTNNKPNRNNHYSQFMDNDYWETKSDSYWWKPIYEAPITRQIRIDYLSKLIFDLKTEY